MKMKILSKQINSFVFFLLYITEIFSKPNITKHRDGPNMVNFEKEIRDGAFDSELPPMRVIL